MKFAILLLASIAAAAPPSDKMDKKLIITKKFFPENFTIYTSKHDIVDIIVPLNSINYPDDCEEAMNVEHLNFFFVEADIKENGEEDYKGLYVYKDNKAKKLLDNGQCATYAKKTIAYFGAKDGIYKYNHQDATATKYGTVTESVIKMAIDTEKAHLYYLTEDYVLYKYDEDEVKTSKVDAIKDARDMTFDFDGNMFYYDGKKQFYVYKDEKIIKIEGLPANPTKVKLLRVPVLLDEAFALIDNDLYSFTASGKSVNTLIEFQAMPTAYAPDTIVSEYYAYNKKIYEYNLYTLMEDKSTSIYDELCDFFAVKNNAEVLTSVKTSTRKVSSRL